jgi:soluble P-type ATPase
MRTISIPGGATLAIEYLVLDYNGTLAVDGALRPGVLARLNALAEEIQVHVVTADTFGMARSALEGAPCVLSILPPGGQDAAKLAYVQDLGPERTAAIGNGRNDRLMLEAAALGVAVMEGEGVATAALLAADVVAPGILPALDLLLNPLRLIATLRQ